MDEPQKRTIPSLDGQKASKILCIIFLVVSFWSIFFFLYLKWSFQSILACLWLVSVQIQSIFSSFEFSRHYSEFFLWKILCISPQKKGNFQTTAVKGLRGPSFFECLTLCRKTCITFFSLKRKGAVARKTTKLQQLYFRTTRHQCILCFIWSRLFYCPCLWQCLVFFHDWPHSRFVCSA